MRGSTGWLGRVKTASGRKGRSRFARWAGGGGRAPARETSGTVHPLPTAPGFMGEECQGTGKRSTPGRGRPVVPDFISSSLANLDPAGWPGFVPQAGFRGAGFRG